MQFIDNCRLTLSLSAFFSACSVALIEALRSFLRASSSFFVMVGMVVGVWLMVGVGWKGEMGFGICECVVKEGEDVGWGGLAIVRDRDN